MLGLALGGVRSPSLRHVAIRLALLAGYAAVSGLAGALLFGPAMGVAPGYRAALAGVGMLVLATATAGLQAAMGIPGTLLAIIAMVVFGDPTAGTSIAAPLLASPWNMIGQGLPTRGRARRRPQRDLPQRAEPGRAADRAGHLRGGRDAAHAGRRSLVAAPSRRPRSPRPASMIPAAPVMARPDVAGQPL